MASSLPANANGTSNGDASNQQAVKEGLARMLKGGVIMDVVNAEQVGSILVLRFSAVRHEPTVCVRFSFKQAEDHSFSWALRNSSMQILQS